MAHGLRGEIDQRRRPQRRDGPIFDAGVAVPGVAQARSTPASRAASTRSASCGARSPSTRSQPSNVREACSVLTWPCSVGSSSNWSSAAAGQWRAASRNPSAFSVLACSSRTSSWSAASWGGGGRSRSPPADVRSTAGPRTPRRRRSGAASSPIPAATRLRRPARADPVRSVVHAAADSAPSSAHPPFVWNLSKTAADKAWTALHNCSSSSTTAGSSSPSISSTSSDLTATNDEAITPTADPPSATPQDYPTNTREIQGMRENLCDLRQAYAAGNRGRRRMCSPLLQ